MDNVYNEKGRLLCIAIKFQANFKDVSNKYIFFSQQYVTNDFLHTLGRCVTAVVDNVTIVS